MEAEKAAAAEKAVAEKAAADKAAAEKAAAEAAVVKSPVVTAPKVDLFGKKKKPGLLNASLKKADATKSPEKTGAVPKSPEMLPEEDPKVPDHLCVKLIRSGFFVQNYST